MDDARLTMLRQWCEKVLGHGKFELTVASADASFRRYFRLHGPEGAAIVMDAPPERCGSQDAFVAVAGMLRDAGVHAPEVRAGDRRHGFLMLEDLGEQTYLDVIGEADAQTLMEDAIGALVRMQQIDPGDRLPPYDRARLRAELALFPNWFVARHQRIDLTPAQRDRMTALFELLEDAALAQPRVFVHRDYMPRNLMVSDPNPGVIDFQDAVAGPVTYDVLSLLRDAFLSWPEERVGEWLAQYWRQARSAGIDLPADLDTLRRDFDWMGVQRHLKVIGIFARLCYRDSKPQYLKDTPRFFRYLRESCARYRELAPLLGLLDELGSAPAAERPPVSPAESGP